MVFIDTFFVDRIYIFPATRKKARPPMVPLDFSMTRVLTVRSASPFNAALHAKFAMPFNNPSQ